MTKKILSVFLVILLCCSVVFQCSLNANAVFGVDDALLIAGLTCELLGAGITIYSVSQFVQSPTFNDFANSVVDHVDRELSLIKLNGQLFFDMTKFGWMKLTNWVKSHFNGTDQTKTIEYDTLTATPEFLILSDGTHVPYDNFMESPFFIFRGNNSTDLYAYYVDNETAAIIPHYYDVQFYCVGSGKIYCMRLRQNDTAWTLYSTKNMLTGVNFKGQPGASNYQNISSPNGCNKESFFLYRTIDIVTNDLGDINTNFSEAQDIPGGTGTATVTAHSDAKKYPGAIDSPATNIGNNESVLVKVPDNLIVDDGTGNPTITTDSEVIGNTLADLTVDDVQPKIKTETVAEGAETVVGNVVADTANPSLSGNASSDIETANKFRLPKSFLEGFPFSIPYSMFVGIKSLVADPQAPVYDIPFKIARLNIDENIHLDLNQFNPLAKLCRALLSIVWVAGLAMTCNKFIKR